MDTGKPKFSCRIKLQVVLDLFFVKKKNENLREKLLVMKTTGQKFTFTFLVFFKLDSNHKIIIV
jgi:hypothetical protein